MLITVSVSTALCHHLLSYQLTPFSIPSVPEVLLGPCHLFTVTHFLCVITSPFPSSVPWALIITSLAHTLSTLSPLFCSSLSDEPGFVKSNWFMIVSNLKQALRCGLADHICLVLHSPTLMVVFMKFLLSSNLSHRLPLPLNQKRTSAISHYLIYPPASIFTFSSLVGNEWLLAGATCTLDPSSSVRSVAQDLFLLLPVYHHFPLY